MINYGVLRRVLGSFDRKKMLKNRKGEILQHLSGEDCKMLRRTSLAYESYKILHNITGKIAFRVFPAAEKLPSQTGFQIPVIPVKNLLKHTKFIRCSMNTCQ